MRDHHSAYDAETTDLCERVLVTFLGDIGPWKDRLVLVGGLAPRYIVGSPPEGVRHVGTNDVDVSLQIGIADGDEEAYRTLQTNLEKAHFEPGDSTFQWDRRIDKHAIRVEFLCETDQVAVGHIFNPKNQKAGHALGAVNMRGMSLAHRDFIVHRVETLRLDDGGRSKVDFRVTNILPFIVLKTLAFQERHENKDAYDLIFSLINYRGGPSDVSRTCRESPVWSEPLVRETLDLLGSRFESIDHDGPIAYARFSADSDDSENFARFQRDAHAAVGQFLGGM